MFERWLQDEAGATAIEYALIAAITAITAISGLSLLGGNTNGMWFRVGSSISSALK